MRHLATAAPTKKEWTGRLDWAETIRNWLMSALSLVFIVLYVAALVGWLRPISDITMLSRLEPIIFVIIGYFLARLPALQNEKTHREEIDRQIKRSDEAYQLKERAQLKLEALEERIGNARSLLEREISKSQSNVSCSDDYKSINGSNLIEGRAFLNRSVEIVRRFLDSSI